MFTTLDFLFQAQFEQLENEMKDSNANYEALMKSFLELTELKHILRKTQTFFEEVTRLHMLTLNYVYLMYTIQYNDTRIINSCSYQHSLTSEI